METPEGFDPWHLLHLVWTGVAAAGWWFVRRYITKVENMELAQQSFITREELQRQLTDMRTESQRQHDEKQRALEQIQKSIERVHDRVDEIWQRQ